MIFCFFITLLLLSAHFTYFEQTLWAFSSCLFHHFTYLGRSSCVSILVHRGMDVKSIQKWVGHADIDTTLKIYAKVKDKEAKKEISDAMTGIISLKDYPDK